MNPKALARAMRSRDDWNDNNPPGTFVRFWQLMKPGQWMIAPTVSAAFVHGSGACVHVLNIRQPVYLSKLEVVSAETLAAIEGRQASPASSSAPRGRDLALPAGDRLQDAEAVRFRRVAIAAGPSYPLLRHSRS